MSNVPFPSVQIDIDSIKDQVASLAREAKEVIRTSYPEIRGKIQVPLKRLVEEDFRIKSRGGTGAGSIKWRRLKQSTINRKNSDIIGIEFGDMLASLRVTSGGGQSVLEISFDNEHAEFFDMERSLLPDGDVPQWLSELEPLIEEVLTQQIQRQIDKT